VPLPAGHLQVNKVEHRQFSHISMNRRDRPLVSHEAIVEPIAATRTHAGLKVRAELDQGSYPLGVKVSDRELAAVPLRRHDLARGVELHRPPRRRIATPELLLPPPPPRYRGPPPCRRSRRRGRHRLPDCTTCCWTNSAARASPAGRGRAWTA